jgi:hypothetical protein
MNKSYTGVMSTPIPKTVSPLPTPEGFSTLQPADKTSAIEQLRTDPGTDLQVLQGIAWDVLNGTVYGSRMPNRELFSEASLALLTIIDRKDELPPDDPSIYLDTRLTLATHDAFAARRQKLMLGPTARFQIARNAGSILKEVAEPVDFDLNALPQQVRPKALDAMMIGISAMRQRWPHPVVIPSMPVFHRLWHIDAGTNTSAFSLYLTRRADPNQPGELVVPLDVTRNIDGAMHDPTRRRGVFQVAMEPLLWNTSNAIEGLLDERRRHGDMVTARTWLLGQTARQLAMYGASGEMSGDYLNLVDLAARYVGKSAENYDPNGLNALAKKPQ